MGEYSDYFAKIFASDLIIGYIVATLGMFFASLSIIIFTSKNNPLREKDTIETQSSNNISNNKDGTFLSILLVLNHFTMVVIMSATPLHIQDIGESVKLVGVIISYHTLGMFLFSPILGNYVDKYGYKKIYICWLFNSFTKLCYYFFKL